MEPERLVFNPNNPVTVAVERVVDPLAGISRAVRKTITPHGRVVVPHWTAGTDEQHWNLWDRERRAYESGVVDAYATAGLRSPRLCAVNQRSDGAVELLFEDVGGRTGSALKLEDHRRIAHRLGRAQGLIATDPRDFAWSRAPWLSRQWLRKYASSRLDGAAVYGDERLWAHPVVVAGFGAGRHELRRRFGELYDSATKWFDLLDALPRTLCHLDLWPNNAIAATDGTDVLIDWAFVGWGAVGEDPGNWVADTIFDHCMEPEDLQRLEATVWDAYRAGLVDSRWSTAPDPSGHRSGAARDVPSELARLGMCASAVKYIWLPAMMVRNADHVGPTAYGAQDGFPLEVVFARRMPMLLRLLAWIDEAEHLLGELRRELPRL